MEVRTLLMVIVATTLMVACGRDVANPEEQQQIAAVYQEFAEAAVNGRADDLESYWATSCSDAARQTEQDALRILSEAFKEQYRGSEYTLRFAKEDFQYDVLEGGEQVRVPAQEPSVIEPLVDGEPIDTGGASAMGGDHSLILVREEGQWKVATCDFFTQITSTGGTHHERGHTLRALAGA